MFSPANVIQLKRDAGELAGADIRAFISGVTDGSVTDAQLGAFTMAVCHQGMSMAEQTALTLAMRDSGEVLSWPGIDGPVLDKHSTGGVGDMVSLILGPLLAACGAHVPMISGRGLGHTGGTLDKLESIPGFSAHPDLEQFRRQVREVGVAIIGQTGQLAPADRRMYATRDVTSTVASVPLIVSSILSKKLAEGLDGLVLDVKTGNGAFMRDLDAARELAANVATVSRAAGLPCVAVISDMNQPLAWSAGNALEVREVVAFLRGRRNCRLREVIFELAGELLLLGALADGREQAHEMLVRALDSGLAAERFERMVSAQGGPADLLMNVDRHLQAAPVTRSLHTGSAGYVRHIDTRRIGEVVMQLGGGRRRVDDNIDHRVGLSELCSIGDFLEDGATLATVHAATEEDWRQAASVLTSAITIDAEACATMPCIYEKWSEDH